MLAMELKENVARALQSRCAVYSVRFNVSQMEGQDLCKHIRVAVFIFFFFFKELTRVCIA